MHNSETRAKFIRDYLVTSSIDLYDTWLWNYCIEQNKKATDIYYFDFDGFHLINSHALIPCLKGSLRLNIIIPEHIEVCFEDIGDNNLFFYKDFIHVGKWIPIFKNNSIWYLRGYYVH